jgi:hypothetical protein
MPLRYDYSAVHNCDIYCVEERTNKKGKMGKYLTGLTNTLIFAGNAVGFGKITAKNYKQYHNRIAFYENQYGAFLYTKQGDPRYIRLIDVYRHIGLHTNWSNKTEEEWLRDFYKGKVYEMRDPSSDRFKEFVSEDYPGQYVKDGIAIACLSEEDYCGYDVRLRLNGSALSRKIGEEGVDA